MERDSHLIAEVTAALVLNDGSGTGLRHAVGAISRAFGVPYVAVWTSESNQAFKLLAVGGSARAVGPSEGSTTLDDGRIGIICQTRLAVSSASGANSPLPDLPEWARQNRLLAFAGFPLLVGNRLVGVLALYSWDRLPDDLHKLCPCLANIVALGIDRERTESSLQTARRQLESTQKLETLGKLTGGVVHDFSNLMVVVTGYCEMILQGKGDSYTFRADIEEVKKAGQRAGSLARRLLAFARHKAVQQKVLDLNGLIADLCSTLRRLIGENIELVTAPDIEPATIMADAGQIEQVIINLVLNARDAMPNSGTIRIEVTTIEGHEAISDDRVELPPGQQVQLTVSDSGIGIEPHVLPHIFEPFFTTKQPDKGTGIGLSTVQDVVAQNGGIIRVSSEPGNGTVFNILFPRAEVVANRNQPAETERRQNAAVHETVLLVEDDDMVRRLMDGILRSQGYTVLQARNGKEALELYRRHNAPVDVLVSDVVMPQMSGTELAERLTEEKAPPKVVFVTGHVDCVVASPRLVGGDVAFIQKPFSDNELLDCVRALLDGTIANQNVSSEVIHAIDAA